MATVTTGNHDARLTCPECGQSATIKIHVGTRLTVEPNASQLSLRIKAKPLDHSCDGSGITPAMFDTDGDVVDADVVAPGELQP